MTALRVKSLADLPARYQSQPGAAPTFARKSGKYRSIATVVDGQRFDSKLEARCYRELVLRMTAGEVRWFIRQVPFRLEGGVIYCADFLAMLMTGGCEVIDAKGMLTQASANKIKQVKARYGIDVMLWTGKS